MRISKRQQPACSVVLHNSINDDKKLGTKHAVDIEKQQQQGITCSRAETPHTTLSLMTGSEQQGSRRYTQRRPSPVAVLELHAPHQVQ
jgi:hypothetical protein